MEKMKRCTASRVEAAERSPREVVFLRDRDVFLIACGSMHTAVLGGDGSLYTAGLEGNGRLGRKLTEEEHAHSCGFAVAPLQAGVVHSDSSEGMSAFVPQYGDHVRCTYVACGGAHTVCLTDTRTVMSFGSNSHGQLGLGDMKDRVTATEVELLRGRDVSCVALGLMHSLAITQKGDLYSWGCADQGALGLGTKAANKAHDVPECQKLPMVNQSLWGCPVTQISAGASHTVVMTRSLVEGMLELEHTQPDDYEKWRSDRAAAVAEWNAHIVQHGTDLVHRRAKSRWAQHKTKTMMALALAREKGSKNLGEDKVRYRSKVR
jgi:alpha-tubulin suppressor-like RCC1 family protein